MFQDKYIKGKEKLLNDKSICQENRTLFKKVLDFKEKKLRRQNQMINLDESSYNTLYGYVIKFKKVNTWFNNKPLKKLTSSDIKKVFEDLQEGNIKRSNGQPYEITTYFNQVFKSTLFDYACKKSLVKKIMREEFYKVGGKTSVRIISHDDIKKIIQYAIGFHHKAYLQLYYDIGENANSICNLEKRDFIRKINPHTKEIEYHVILRKEILKRSRTARTEITNFKETSEYLDELLNQKIDTGKKDENGNIIYRDMQDNDKLFSFELRQAEKFFKRVVRVLNIKTNLNDEPMLKDIRSSMACYLLETGWSIDEVNARLGHAVGSKEVKKYVSYLAIDRSKSKTKIYQSNIAELKAELEESKQREKIKDLRHDNEIIEMKNKILEMEQMKTSIKNDVSYIKRIMEFMNEQTLKQPDIKIKDLKFILPEQK